MEKFKILSGLPVYGEMPKQFSATGLGTHSEGLVVQFFPSENQDSWIGNFQRGLNSFDDVFQHPDNSSVVVVAGGECYIVDIENRSVKETFGGQIETIIYVPEKNIVIFGDLIGFDAIDSSGDKWQSKRISWDGIRHLNLEGNTLKGEAWSFEDWIPFSLDIDTGKHTGGAKVE